MFEKEVIPQTMEQLKSQGHCFNKIENLEEKKKIRKICSV